MKRNFLVAKLHKALATDCNLEYQGSLSIDHEILQAAGILENERVHVYNLENGCRFSTYAIKAAAGSKVIGVNGAAAHLVDVGHRLIICTYADLEEAEWLCHNPTVLFMDKSNNWTKKLEQDEHSRMLRGGGV